MAFSKKIPIQVYIETEEEKTAGNHEKIASRLVARGDNSFVWTNNGR